MNTGQSFRHSVRSINRRRSSKLALAALSAAGMFSVSSRPANAQLYWDLNGATTGAGGATPNGTWDLTSNEWTTDPLGLSATTPWASGNSANFSAGKNATGSYTVTVASGTTVPGVNGIGFNFGSVTLAGDSTTAITLAGTTATISTATNGVDTISTNLVGSPSSGVTISVGTNSFLTLSGNNTFTGPILIDSAATGSANNTYTPNGRIIVTSSTAFGNSTNAISFDPREAAAPQVASGSFAGAYTVDGLGIDLTNGVNIPNSITLNGGQGSYGGPGELNNLSGSNVWSGTINLANGNPANNSVVGECPEISVTSGTLTISGNILSPGGPGVEFIGENNGTVILTGSSSFGAGVIRPLGGHIILQNSNALGNSSNSTFGITGDSSVSQGNNSGASTMIGLQAPSGAGNGLTVSAPWFEFAGTAYPGAGFLQNLSGINTINATGSIELYNVSEFNSNAIAIPNAIGVNADTGTMGVVADKLVIDTPLLNSSTSQRSLVKMGPGLLELGGKNTVTGPMIVAGGTLSFVGALGSNIAANATTGNQLQVNPGASLRLDDSQGATFGVDPNDGNRIEPAGGAYPVKIMNADLSMVGDTLSGPNDPFDVVYTQIGSELDLYGSSTVTMTTPGPDGQSLALTASAPNTTGSSVGATQTGTMVRENNATVVFRGPALGTGAPGANVSTVLLPTAMQTTIGGIIPWALYDSSASGSGSDFATYNATNGVQVLASYDTNNNIDSDNASANTTANDNLTAPVTVSNSDTVNAIKFSGGGNHLTLSNQLVVSSGALLNATGGTVTIDGTGPLQFNGQEGIIHANSNVVVSAPIAGTGGLTKGGPGDLYLQSTSNNFATLTIDDGNVVADTEAELGSGNTIVLNGGSIKPTSTLATISSHPFTLASMGGFNVPTGQKLTVSSNINGVGSLVSSGGGTLVLTGSNGYTGALDIQAGTVEISAAKSVGASAPLANAAGIADNSTEIRFDGGALQIDGNTTFGSTAANGGNSGQNFYFATDGTISVASGATANIPTWLYGPGQLFKTGAGTLNISDAMTVSNFLEGTTTSILGGTLEFSTTYGLPHLPVGNNPIANFFFIDNNATLQLNPTVGGTGTLAVAVTDTQCGLTLGTGGGNIDVDNLATSSYAGPITGPSTGTLSKVGTGTLSLTNPSNSYTGGTDVKAGFIGVTADSATANSELGAPGTSISLDGGGLYAGTSVTYTLTRPIMVTANNGTISNIEGTNGAGTLTQNGAITGPGVLNKIGNATLVLGNGSSNWSGGLAIHAGQVDAGNNSFMGAANSTYTLDGGTMVLTGSGFTTAHDFVVTANNGTIAISTATGNFTDTTYAVTGPGVFNKAGGGSFTTLAVQTNGLNVAAGTLAISAGRNTATKTSVINGATLTVAAASALNLNDNDLIYNYGSTVDSTKAAAIRTLLASGYAASAWTGTGGINSGTAAANNAVSGNPKLGIAYAEASTVGITGTYDGQTLTGGSVVTKYDYLGDANMDGTVNALDFNAVATNYGKTPGANVWVQGDFNYDGSVDSNDFALLAANYGQSAPLSASLPDGALPMDSAATAMSLGSVVPEPTTLSLLGIATLGLMSRRRRNV